MKKYNKPNICIYKSEKDVLLISGILDLIFEDEYEEEEEGYDCDF